MIWMIIVCTLPILKVCQLIQSVFSFILFILFFPSFMSRRVIPEFSASSSPANFRVLRMRTTRWTYINRVLCMRTTRWTYINRVLRMRTTRELYNSRVLRTHADYSKSFTLTEFSAWGQLRGTRHISGYFNSSIFWSWSLRWRMGSGALLFYKN